MSSPTGPPSSLLYTSADNTVFVLDIPRSIELGQIDALAHPKSSISSSRQLISCPPIEEPLPSQEPISIRARQKLLTSGQDSDKETARLIQDVLEQLHYPGPFCLPRWWDSSSDSTNRNKDHDKVDCQSFGLTKHFRSMINSYQTSVLPPSQIGRNSGKTINLIQSPAYSNVMAMPIRLSSKYAESNQTLHFTIPPYASFLLHDLPLVTPSLAPTPPKGFDLILLDPPWPNRSAKRSSAYETHSFNNMRQMLSNLNLSTWFNTESSVTLALWITNSTKVRQIVMGERGWLAELGMQVVEEWLWVKVTASGQPILPATGIWRKPYETLLIARNSNAKNLDITKRVILAVPDLHSRKPCLKELFQKLNVSDGRETLEIFARNLTSGWHAWGNEVLKFNWDGHWSGSTNGDAHA